MLIRIFWEVVEAIKLDGIFFQKQWHIGQYLEEWLYPITGQSNQGLFSDKDKQESTQIKGLYP